VDAEVRSQFAGGTGYTITSLRYFPYVTSGVAPVERDLRGALVKQMRLRD
jgi:hypothetical protein